MKHHKYLIVGGGMTADSAAHDIRKIDQDGAIAMICEEQHKAYDRPPLSKALWKGAPYESIWREGHGLNVAMHLGKKVVSVDPSKKSGRTTLEIFIPTRSSCFRQVEWLGGFPILTVASFITGLLTTIESCVN